MTKSVLDKLPGIKSDLVRGEEGWQGWGLAQLVTALKLWRDINPCSEEGSKDKKRRDRSEKILNTGAKKQGCVYCDDMSHKSHGCTRVTDVNERKKILANKRLCLAVRERDIELLNVKTKTPCLNLHHEREAVSY